MVRRELVLSRWYGRRHLDTRTVKRGRLHPKANIVTVQRPPNLFTFVVRRRATTRFNYELFNSRNQLRRSICTSESLYPPVGRPASASKGWVSIDRSVVAALPSTTPRPVHKSSTDDLGPISDNVKKIETTSYSIIPCTNIQGIARTQTPTNKNYALELFTFETIVGVNLSVVQWTGLTQGEPPASVILTS